MGLFDDASLNFSDSFADAGSSWGTDFSTSDWESSIFDDPSWFSNFEYSSPDYSSVFSDPDWFGSSDWSTSYDPLTDQFAESGDINSYVTNMLADPDLYSMVGGDQDYGLSFDSPSDLTIGSPNVLGELLSSDPVDSSSSSMTALNKLLSSLLGGAKSATDSPLGKLAQLYLANEAKKKALSNQRSAMNNSVAMAQGNSQQAMTGNRRAPYTVQQRDPLSYIAQAPLIKDR